MELEQEILDICTQHNINVKRLSRIEQGFSNKVFNINDEFIIRFNDEKSFLREAQHITFLKEQGMNVPTIVACSKQYMLLEKIKGVTLENCELNEQIYEQVGRTLKQLHSIRQEGNDSFKKYILKELTRAQSANIPTKVKQFLLETNLNLEQQQFIHWDPARSNTLLTDNNEIVLIDFEWSEFGDPLYDLAVFEIKHEERFHQAFKKGYGTTTFNKLEEQQILAYKIIHELNVFYWAQKRNRTKIMQIQKNSLNKLFAKVS